MAVLKNKNDRNPKLKYSRGFRNFVKNKGFSWKEIEDLRKDNNLSVEQIENNYMKVTGEQIKDYTEKRDRRKRERKNKPVNTGNQQDGFFSDESLTPGERLNLLNKDLVNIPRDNTFVSPEYRDPKSRTPIVTERNVRVKPVEQGGRGVFGKRNLNEGERLDLLAKELDNPGPGINFDFPITEGQILKMLGKENAVTKKDNTSVSLKYRDPKSRIPVITEKHAKYEPIDWNNAVDRLNHIMRDINDPRQRDFKGTANLDDPPKEGEVVTSITRENIIKGDATDIAPYYKDEAEKERGKRDFGKQLTKIGEEFTGLRTEGWQKDISEGRIKDGAARFGSWLLKGASYPTDVLDAFFRTTPEGEAISDLIGIPSVFVDELPDGVKNVMVPVLIPFRTGDPKEDEAINQLRDDILQFGVSTFLTKAGKRGGKTILKGLPPKK